MKNQIEWRPVNGYEGKYEVSSNGEIRALYREQTFSARWGLSNMRFPARIMKLSVTKLGYLYLSLHKDGISRKYLVHRLVMAAFVGENPLQVNHKDGNKANNNLENLEYCTSKENNLHCCKVLKKKIGEKNGNHKLTERDVIAIRKDKRFLREIAADYGVSLQAIHHAKTGKNWAYLNDNKLSGEVK